MKRRALLRYTAALAAAVFTGLPKALWAREPAAAGDAALALLERPLMLAQFIEAGDIALIGREYLRQPRVGRSAQALRDALLARLGGPAAGDLRARLDHVVRQDYATHRTTMLAGWVISETEARQCALFALAHH